MSHKIYSISSLVRYLKRVFDNDSNVKDIYVQAEISNITYASSGHIYFSLKDANTKLSCVFFKFNQKNINYRFQDGDSVVVRGGVSVYENSGTIQFYVKEMSLAGVGDLYRQFEQLKIRLQQLGLFDNLHKKVKPNFPMRIAVLVGKDSAAESDIRSCFARRWPLASVDYHYVLVQGKESAQDIIHKLQEVDCMQYEAIILARGGGSIEDLWSFNGELLAHQIFSLNTFIITGIGHQQDFTIADFVADLRAPTPTAAVELLTPDCDELLESLQLLRSHLKSRFNSLYNSYNLKLQRYQNRLLFFQQKCLSFQSQLQDLKARNNQAFLGILNKKANNLTLMEHSITSAYQKRFTQAENLLKRYKVLLEAYNPLDTLKRGYSITYKNGNLMKTVQDIQVNDILSIKLCDGTVDVQVKEINDGDNI